jgi:hypothetical protein
MISESPGDLKSVHPGDIVGIRTLSDVTIQHFSRLSRTTSPGCAVCTCPQLLTASGHVQFYGNS